MGAKDFWTLALGLFRNKEKERLVNYRGTSIIVDISIFSHSCDGRAETQYAATNVPQYPSPELVASVRYKLNRLRACGLVVSVCFDGFSHPMKKETQAERREKKREAKESYKNHLERAKKLIREGNPIPKELLEAANKSRKESGGLSILDTAALMILMKRENIPVYVAPFESDAQMVELEKSGVIKGICTEDGDIVILGGGLVFSKMEFGTIDEKPEHAVKARVYKREEFFNAINEYHSQLHKWKENLPEVSAFLGNDYIKRVKNVGVAAVLMDSEHSGRSGRGLMDKLMSAPNRQQFLEQYESNRANAAPEGYAQKYIHSVNLIKYFPVLRQTEDGRVELAPLNSVPDGVEWGQIIGFSVNNPSDILASGGLQSSDYDSYFHGKFLPSTMQPPSQLKGPLYSDDENPKVSQNVPLPLFARLDFEAVPVEMQPDHVLENFLLARGVVRRPRDTRAHLEYIVRVVIELNHMVLPPELQPKQGKYTGFEALRIRDEGDEPEHWNSDILPVVKMLKKPDTEYLNRHFGSIQNGDDVAGINERGFLLAQGGNFHLESACCLKVQSKITKGAMVLLRCYCLSSERSVIHSVHACFEDAEDGEVVIAPHSTCSCEDGDLFCSHLLGLLLVMRLMHKWDGSLTEFITKYPDDPKRVQSEPMLVENMTAMDHFKRGLGQRKRRRDEQGEE